MYCYISDKANYREGTETYERYRNSKLQKKTHTDNKKSH